MSWQQIPHVTHHDLADVTELERWRREQAPELEEAGGSLSLMVIVMKAVAGVLKRHPRFNASLDAEAGEIVVKQHFHIGLAVDTEDGLIVPVIRDVDRKPLADLAVESRELIRRVRARQVDNQDLQGGTFTITNVGPLGGTGFTPLIRHPEVAILLRGCIPSKALLEVADVVHLSREAAERGVDFGEPKFDLERLRSWKQQVVTRLVDGLETIASRRGITMVRARAAFEGAGAVGLMRDGERHRMAFRQAIIATGSQPVALPDTGFSQRILDSSRALDLPDLPEKLLVVGGGYVGLELGTVYATLGSSVTLVEMTDRLLPTTDEDLVRPLERHARDLFGAVHLETTVTGMDETDSGVVVSFEGRDDVPDRQTFDRVLVAVGRRPASGDLGLDRTRVATDEHGFIRVDDQRRTAEPTIFAIGDVAGGMLLAHEAMHEGMVAAEAAAGEPAAFDLRAIPAVVYTDPQIAWCGLTEQDAREQGHKVEVTRSTWRASGRALTMGSGDGMTKLITEPGSGRVLGVGMVGRGAESLISEGVLAVEMGAVAEDLALAVAPHPTLSETLHEAAQLLLGRPTHLPPRA